MMYAELIWAGVAISAVAVANVAVVVAAWSMFARRRELLIRARSPYLGLLQTVSLAIQLNAFVFQEIARLLGYKLPCAVLIWATYTCGAPIILTIVCRGKYSYCRSPLCNVDPHLFVQ
jgi:hypothetical protein